MCAFYQIKGNPKRLKPFNGKDYLGPDYPIYWPMASCMQYHSIGHSFKDTVMGKKGWQ